MDRYGGLPPETVVIRMIGRRWQLKQQHKSRSRGNDC
jgi:hypothetical protein